MTIGMRTKIRPSDINTDGPFAPLFGFDRANYSAKTLVKLAQLNGSWRHFKIGEADRFAETPFVFNGLTSGRRPLIVRLGDGMYVFTDEFVETCAASAPRRPTTTAQSLATWRGARRISVSALFPSAPASPARPESSEPRRDP